MRDFLDREIKCNSMHVKTLQDGGNEEAQRNVTAAPRTQGHQIVEESEDDFSAGLNEEEEAVYLALEQEFLSA
jgi:hypothetical protein